jgi:hypothetical protein
MTKSEPILNRTDPLRRCSLKLASQQKSFLCFSFARLLGLSSKKFSGETNNKSGAWV